MAAFFSGVKFPPISKKPSRTTFCRSTFLSGIFIPFEETTAKPGATEAEIIEQIDIGGPAMLRSAAKNFQSVALLTIPIQYKGFLEMLASLNGGTDITYRKKLAYAEGFEHVANMTALLQIIFKRIAIRPRECS